MRRQRNLLGPQGMGGMVSLWGASSLIKSIQYGTTSTTGTTTTATITSVDTNNACLIYLGCTSTNSADGGYWTGSCVLTNSTTVTTNYQTTSGETKILGFCVVEYQPGVFKSLQTFSISLISAASATTTITAVNVAKSQIISGGMQTYGAAMTQPGRVTLTNATTVTLNRVATDAYTTIIPGCVIEYF